MLDKLGLKTLKSKTRLGVFTLAALFGLGGCGGGGSGSGGNGSGSDNSGSNDPVIPTQEYIIGKSQAGTVHGANISIETSSGVVLYSIKTDENGEYKILKTEIEKQLENLGLNKEDQLFIYSRGGTDLDPNNDIDKPINGEMVSVLPYNKIDKSIITPISTLVFDLLVGKNKQNLEGFKTSSGKLDSIEVTQQINKILSTLALSDITGDGQTTVEDIRFYDMKKNESNIETDIRNNGYLDSIHSGNINEQRKMKG